MFIAVALLYLQWLPAVRAVDEARGDPSTQAAFHQEVLEFLHDRARPGERLEVPLTRNHWEATYLAEDYPLARGWHRQLDRKVNPLFYDSDHPLAPDAYRDWLRENAVRWVALPNAPLDFSATAERKLLLEGLPFLKPVHESADWRIWEVEGTEPPVSGPARLTAAGANGFDLEATRPGRVIVRQHDTPYWTIASGDGEAGHQPFDVPLERARQRLVEVVDAEDELPVRGGEDTEVGQMRVAAQLHSQVAAWRAR